MAGYRAALPHAPVLDVCLAVYGDLDDERLLFLMGGAPGLFGPRAVPAPASVRPVGASDGLRQFQVLAPEAGP